jgi:hypothetical protein
MARLEFEVGGVRYEVAARYERLPGDGGPGWTIESIEPDPPDRATEREVERLAADVLACEPRPDRADGGW